MSRVSVLTFLSGLLIVLLAVIASGTPAAAGTNGISLETIGSFDRPIVITQPRGRGPLMVAEQSGKIRARVDGRWQTFLNLSDRISFGGEQGLLGLAFHPNYQNNRRFYVNYTDRQGDTKIVEYRKSRKHWRANPKSRRLLFSIPQPYENHNGGQLAFDSHALLYIATGDGGSGGDPENRAQNKKSLLGKILRINPLPTERRAYTVPGSNPFVGRNGNDLIFSYGLRNPWRFSFDYSTMPGQGRIFIGDVGQNQWEEINYETLDSALGANFGWSRFEGNEIYNSNRTAPGAVFPVHVYNHDQDGSSCSVTGGLVVQDPDLPELKGRYLYADFCAGELRSFSPNLVAVEDDRLEGINAGSVVSFGQDQAKNVYIASLEGQVYRIEPALPVQNQVTVTEKEFKMTLSQQSVSAGQVTINVVNSGEDPHDVYLQRQGDTGQPLVIPEVAPGERGSGTFDLQAGVWDVWCGIAGHRPAGMETTLTVI